MTFIFALLLLACAFGAYKWSGSVLFPPVLFSGLWGGILLGLALSGDDFYPLSLTVLSLCFVSVLCFTAGSCFVFRSRGDFRVQKRPRPQPKPALLRFLDVCLIGAIAAFPAYIQRLSSFTQVAPDSNLLRNVRTEAVLGENAQVGFGLFTYILPFALMIALIATAEYCRTGGSRWRPAALIAVTLVYYTLTGSRLDTMLLLIAACCMVVMTKPRLKKLIVLATVCAILAVFAVASIARRVGPEADDDPASWESVSAVAETFRVYVLGGIVACDQRLQNELDPQTDYIHSLSFFYAVGRTLGWTDVNLNPIEPQITTPQTTNVYSIYYYYFRDFGWAGTGLMFMGLGLLLAWLYKKAIRGNPESLVLYCLGCGFLVLTNAADPFLIGFSACLKAAILVVLVYRIPRVFGYARKTAANAGLIWRHSRDLV